MSDWAAGAIGAGIGIVIGAAVLYAVFRWQMRKWVARNW